MDRKDQDPEDPVDEHGVPDTQHAHVQYKDEHMCKTTRKIHMETMEMTMVKAADPDALK